MATYILPSITMTASTLYTDVVWTYWNLYATNTATSSSSIVTWVNWNADYSAYRDTAREYELYEQELRRREAQVRAAHAAVKNRADELLHKMLDAKQQKQLSRDRCFEVIGHKSKKRYRVHYGIAGNIQLLDEKGEPITRFCIHPDGVPEADAMLAQKLMLETDEDRFLRVANQTILRRA